MTTAAAEHPGRDFTAEQLHDVLLRIPNLPGADVRMLFYFATAVPAGEAVPETVSAIGQKLGLSTTSSSRSIHRLVAGGWLELAYVAANIRFYRLGPTATGEAPSEPSEDRAELAVIHHLPVRD
ncbi:MarR family transcriptional regulator [Streptomyces sp. NPDC088745]|uniref:MarR family transcriptional regulator n=1 Tax=Streptomyces sp. NPDC088745 TaxID=3365884 RepID=UPI0037FFD0B7